MLNKTIRLFLTGIALVSFAFAGTIRSQGTAGATQLNIPVGAENIAVSSSNVATVSGVEALFLNPAGVARYQGAFQGTASTMTYIADIDVTHVGFVLNRGKTGSFGLSLKTLDFGDIPVTTAENTEGTGEYFSPSFMTVMANYSKSFADRVQFGANFKIVSEQIINTSARGLAVDLGVQYKFADMPLSFGVVLRNLGARMEYTGSDLEQKLTPSESESGTLKENFRVKAESFELPALLDISASYQVIPGLDLMGSFKNYSFNANSSSFAAKYSIAGIGWIAGGTTIQMISDTQPDDVSNSNWDEWTQSPWGATFGAGVNVPIGGMNLGVAYSIRTVTDYFENNNIFQISVDF